jgi:muramidase (phage lysozyme)
VTDPRTACAESLGSPNVRAFLRVIRAGESDQSDDAYRMIVGHTGARPSLAESLQDHPRIPVHLPRLGVTSTAAGAYQFLSRTWDECARALALPDFGADSQDLAAVYLIRRRGALDDVLSGRIPEALEKCAREWASLPGSPYGQPTIALDRALAVYREWGGTLAAEAPRAVDPPLVHVGPEPAAPGITEERPRIMAPFLAAALPALVELIPRLGRLFGSGSQVSDRNLQAAEAVAQVVQRATSAPNIQTAVEAMRADPAVLQTAVRAVEAHWVDITEAGGGGIEGARKADAVGRAAGDLLHSTSFWVALLLLPLVYLLVLSLIGLIGTATWSDDVRAGLAGSLISAIVGGLVGYYYGQTTSRNRATGATP